MKKWVSILVAASMISSFAVSAENNSSNTTENSAVLIDESVNETNVNSVQSDVQKDEMNSQENKKVEQLEQKQLVESELSEQKPEIKVETEIQKPETVEITESKKVEPPKIAAEKVENIPAIQPQTKERNDVIPPHDLITKRDLVDLFIQKAYQAYKSPARISHAGQTSKLKSNMEIVAENLLYASQLEPYRADLLFSLAGAQISNNNVDQAIATYEQILSRFPGEPDAITYLSAWNRFNRNNSVSQNYLYKLLTLDAGRLATLQQMFSIIDRASVMPIRDSLTDDEKKQLNASNKMAIVALGYALEPDGTMNKTLITRLEKTLELANLFPNAIVVTTGGVPQNGKTEAKLMADWLMNKGIDAKRVFQDNAARTTVENALYSRYILLNQNVTDVVIVSSGSHIRRGKALFEIAALHLGNNPIKYFAVAAEDNKMLGSLQKISYLDLQGIYRDSLKTMGLWSFRSYPLEER